MTDPDRRWAGKAVRGDRRALAVLYERHRSRLMGFLVSQLGDRQTAEEVFQEVWIKVLRNVSHYHSGPGSFRAWLYRIAANAGTDRLRRDKRREADELDAPLDAGGPAAIDLVPSAEPDPERGALSGLLGRDIDRALHQLNAKQRAAVLLRHQQGLSYAEIAEVLALPEGTAKTLVHRGILALRERLGDWHAN